MGKTLTSNVSDGLRALIQGLAGAGMLFHISSPLSFTILSILPPMIVIAGIYGKFVKRISRSTQDCLGLASNVAEEKLSNIRTVKAFAKETTEVGIYEKKIKDLIDVSQKEAIASASFFGVVRLIRLLLLCFYRLDIWQIWHW